MFRTSPAMNHRIPAALVALSALVAREAAAQPTPYPSRIVDRPQTLPARALRLEATFDATPSAPPKCPAGYDPRVGIVTTCGGRFSSPDTALRLRLGASYGVTDVFEVGATVVPLRLTPDASYTDPGAYLRWEIVHHGRAYASLEAAFTWLRELHAGSVRIGVPVWYRFSEWAQVQTGFAYHGFTSEQGAHGVSLPLRFNLTFTDRLYAAVVGEATVWFAGETDVSVTLGVEAGYAFTRADDRPVFDLVGQFRYEPVVGNDPISRATGYGAPGAFTRWVFGLTGRFYLML